jgi:NAD(P)-dependent dehydrogenase (short-subunit alcohol dehydrogenase family)
MALSSRWTAMDIPSLDGRTAVVTGANSGLGFHTALELARHGATVVMACRDDRRAAEALGRLRTELPAAPAATAPLDLANLSSVRDFASDYLSTHDGLDILVNNAGIMATARGRTADGFERQIGTNHFGHFALTGLLISSLLARPQARVVTVSSNAALWGRMSMDDLQSERRYEPWRAYSQSKLANLLFTFELARRAETAGRDVLSVAAHPGFAATELPGKSAIGASSAFATAAADFFSRVFGQTAAQGALPQLYAATAPDVRAGDYFGPDQLFHQRGHPTRVSPPRAALDVDTAQRLWTMSEELTGVTYHL